jgi:hypothetical protein
MDQAVVIVSKNLVRTVAALLMAIPLIPSHAQEATISDPGLNAAIRDALQKPNGQLAEQDLLTQAFLSAGGT